MAETSAPQGGNSLGSSLAAFLDRRFGLAENSTTVRTEFIAGMTTFLTMVYIVFVNPEILSNTGMDRGAVFVATCLAAAISTLIMALYANYPIAVAPGMGLNAFFAFTLVLGAYKYTGQQALAFVFISGLLALVITATRLRETIITSIPQNLKLAVSAGVGLFLGIITMPLTFSIATGIGLGFITYALCKILDGRFAEAKPAVIVLAALFAVKFALA